MKNNLTIKEALNFAETTGQLVTITLRSGYKFHDCIVEELWPTSFRIWVNPTETRSIKTLTELSTKPKPERRIEKAIVSINAVEAIAFDDEIQTGCESRSESSSESNKGIREALCIALLTRQAVEVALFCKEKHKVILGRIINVQTDTFCIRSVLDDKMKIEKIANCEYVLFS